MAFMKQHAGSNTMRPWFCHDASIGSPGAKANGQTDLQEAVLDERPLNNKCPKIAEIQSTNKVGDSVTEDTSTHCVGASSHSDSVDRLTPIIQPTGNTDSESHNVCKSVGPGTCGPPELLSQDAGADRETVVPHSATELRPSQAQRPQRHRRTPARFLSNVCVRPGNFEPFRQTGQWIPTVAMVLSAVRVPSVAPSSVRPRARVAVPSPASATVTQLQVAAGSGSTVPDAAGPDPPV